MPGQIPMGDIVDRVIEGIGKAQRDYKKWSGDENLDNAPEYLITVSIAQSIAQLRLDNYFITLEGGVKGTLESCGALGKGRIHRDMRANGKFDIVIWWAGGTPRAVIEVKHNIWFFRRLRIDLQRIGETLKRKSDNSTLQFGILAFYISCEGKDSENAQGNVKRKIHYLYQKSKAILDGDFTVNLREGNDVKRVEDKYAWEAVALVIRRKSTESS